MFCQQYQNDKVLKMATDNIFLLETATWSISLRAYITLMNELTPVKLILWVVWTTTRHAHSFQAAKFLTFKSMLCWISENHCFAQWKKEGFGGAKPPTTTVDGKKLPCLKDKTNREQWRKNKRKVRAYHVSLTECPSGQFCRWLGCQFGRWLEWQFGRWLECQFGRWPEWSVRV